MGLLGVAGGCWDDEITSDLVGSFLKIPCIKRTSKMIIHELFLLYPLFSTILHYSPFNQYFQQWLWITRPPKFGWFQQNGINGIVPKVITWGIPGGCSFFNPSYHVGIFISVYAFSMFS
jgi:hypothetical protein